MAADRTNCRGRQEASGSPAHVKPVSLASLAPRARATQGEPALELQPRVTPRRTLRTTGSAEAAPGREVGARRAARLHQRREANGEQSRASGPARRIVDGRRSDPGKSGGLTATRRKRIQRSRRRSETNEPRAWVERQRSVSPAWHAVDNAAVGSERESAREGSGRSRVRVVKRVHALLDAKASQAASQRPGGAARRGRCGPSGTSAWPKGHRELGDPRLLTKESIAEVVSERLPVKRRGREVAGRSGWAGRSSLRDGRSGSHGRNGAEKA